MNANNPNNFQRNLSYGLWVFGALGAIIALFKSYRESRDLYSVGAILLIGLGLAYLCFLFWNSPTHFKDIEDRFGRGSLNTLRGVLLVALLLYTPYCIYKAYSEAIKITIEGTLVTATGESVKHAIITIPTITQNKPYSVDNGKFILRDVSVGWFAKDLAIKIKWAAREFEQTIDVSNGSVKDFAVVLKSPPAPFVNGYTTVANQTVNLLLQGKITNEISPYLTNASIIENEVFRFLKELTRQFGQAYPEGEVWVKKDSKNKKKTDEMEDVSKKYLKHFSNRKLLPVSEATEDEISFRLKDLKFIGFPGDNWSLASIDFPEEVPTSYRRVAEESPAEHFQYYRYSTKNDLSLYDFFDKVTGDSSYGTLLNHVTKDYLPDGFAVTVLYYTQCPGQVEGDFIVRPLSVEVLVIENSKDVPMKIGNFRYKKANRENLRSQGENDKDIQGAQPTYQQWFSTEVLQPREKIIIPLSVNFKFGEDELKSITEGIEKTVNKKPSSLKSLIDKTVYWYEDDPAPSSVNKIALTRQFMLSVFDNKLDTSLLKTNYYFGPAILIETVEVDGVPYELRPQNFATRTLFGGSSIGSCPYIYTFNKKDEIWVNQGTILTGFSSPTKSGKDEIELKEFDGKVMIKEKDREVSFIDQLYVKIIDLKGTEYRMLPTDPLLEERDNRYLILKRGDEKIYHFNKPKKCSGCRFFVCAEGYYIPERNIIP